MALILASHVALFLIGLYIGDRLPRQSNPFEFLPSALAGMDPADVDRQVHADLQRLRRVTQGLDEIRASAAAMHDAFLERMDREGRFYFTPEEDDRVRWHLVTYLSYRAALLRLVATYASFEAVPDPHAKARCFLVGYAAAVTAYDAALALVESYGRNPVARRKLNEPEPIWDLPAGMYDRIYESITNSRNYEMALEMSAYHTHNLPRWRKAGVFPEQDLDWLASRIDTCFASVKTRIPARSLARLDLLLERVKEDAYTPVYAAQSILSEWIGDTRIVECKPLITIEQIDEIAPRLRPGDIILERRNWFLSNAFLPGFWPHGALYVGSTQDLDKLGILDDPDVKERLAQFESLAEDGRPHRIIEAVSDGVVFSSLTHSLHADHVAVLRPRLEPDQIAGAIARAFRHHGKPYDFEFDFFTSDKLVCTELIYRAYEGLIDFDLVRVMGRDTLPAIEIVRKFTRERARPDRDLDFVLFLDGSPSGGDAAFAPEDAFCESADRPQAFHK